MKKKLAFKVENELRRKQHESQTSKEGQEKAARRLRAKNRRERKAAEIDNSKRAPRIVKRPNSQEKNGHKPPAVVSSGVSAVKENVLTLDQLNAMIKPELSYIKFCPDHYKQMVKNLKGRDLLPWLAIDVPDLHERLAKKEIEPLFHSFDGLIRLATKAMGPDSLRKFHCPLCAFAKHDFVDQIAEAMHHLIAENVAQRGRTIPMEKLI